MSSKNSPSDTVWFFQFNVLKTPAYFQPGELAEACQKPRTTYRSYYRANELVATAPGRVPCTSQVQATHQKLSIPFHTGTCSCLICCTLKQHCGSQQWALHRIPLQIDIFHLTTSALCETSLEFISENQQELNSVMLVGPLQLKIFHNSSVPLQVMLFNWEVTGIHLTSRKKCN